MSSDYKIRVRNTTGTLVAEITDFLDVSYTKKVNDPGVAKFTVSGNHDIVDLIADKYLVEIHRRNQALGLDWYCDFYGMFRKQQRRYTDQPLFIATCPGQMDLLNWRYVLWYAGTDNRTQFTSELAEDVAYNLVYYNAGTGATTGNDRLREGRLSQTGFTINTSATSGLGNTLDWSCAYKPLLRELQAIAKVGGGDFDLVYQSGSTWNFTWYDGQRGTDLSATVLFGMDYGNMANPVYTLDRIKERTIALVGGRGETSSRMFATSTGTNYSATNDIEQFFQGMQYTTVDGLTRYGEEKLDAKQARHELDFNVLQIPSSAYGVHYCTAGRLGDLVTARYDDIEVTQKIEGVTVRFGRSGDEAIDLRMETQ